MTLDPVHARGVKLMLARRCGELQKASALAERGAECQVHRVTPLLTQTVRPVFQLATSCDELKSTTFSVDPVCRRRASARLLVTDPGNQFPPGKNFMILSIFGAMGSAFGDDASFQYIWQLVRSLEAALAITAALACNR